MRFKIWHLNGELITINAAQDNFVKNEIFIFVLPINVMV